MFKIKTGYHLELLTPETMKLLKNNKSKITKGKNVSISPLQYCQQRLLARFKSLVQIFS